MKDIELFNDHFQNFKAYGIPKAQLIIADVPYNLGANAYASNPAWYVDGDNKNDESALAGKQFSTPTRISGLRSSCTFVVKCFVRTSLSKRRNPRGGEDRKEARPV